MKVYRVYAFESGIAGQVSRQIYIGFRESSAGAQRPGETTVAGCFMRDFEFADFIIKSY